jgi:hypothetical protein
VIDNVVCTDSWLSIASACCGLTRIGAGEEQLSSCVEYTLKLKVSYHAVKGVEL